MCPVMERCQTPDHEGCGKNHVENLMYRLFPGIERTGGAVTSRPCMMVAEMAGSAHVVLSLLPEQLGSA